MYFRRSAPVLLALVFATVLPRSAGANWEVFPESRHHLYQSYGFYIEQHDIVAWLGSSWFWAAVAGNLPIVGNNDLIYHPQLVFHFSGNDSMTVANGGGVYTQTLDTRIGFMYEMEIPQIQIRFSAGYFHESGHVVDGTDQLVLVPLNLGDDVFRVRVIHDFGQIVRVGATWDPISNSIPANLISGLDEFVEYFPIGSREADHKGSPFIAAGVSEAWNFQGTITFHAQTGMAWGNHFELKHQGEIRTVIGYYNGTDPRSKYAQFLGSTVSFGYLAVMFDY